MIEIIIQGVFAVLFIYGLFHEETIAKVERKYLGKFALYRKLAKIKDE